jgi:hypothetical protein
MALEHAAGPRPHRSYRRVRSVDRKGLVATLAVIAILETVIVSQISWLERLFTNIAFHLTPPVDGTLRIASDTYLGARVTWIDFSLPPMEYTAVWLWFVGALVAARVLFVTKRISPPIRLLGSFFAAMVSASALYMLFFGHLGYESEAFSLLYMRTSAIVWLLVPIVVGALSATVPFSSLERFGLALFCWCSVFILSAVRYAMFVWVLKTFGSLFMPTLYLLLGPVLDFIYLMSIFSLFLTPLGRRLDSGRAEVWAWL